jgi:hypothetical protein
MTSGEAEIVRTDRGTIELNHTGREPAEILRRCVQVPGRPLLLASEDLALEDLRLIGRNLNMVQDTEE